MNIYDYTNNKDDESINENKSKNKTTTSAKSIRKHSVEGVRNMSSAMFIFSSVMHCNPMIASVTDLNVLIESMSSNKATRQSKLTPRARSLLCKLIVTEANFSSSHTQNTITSTRQTPQTQLEQERKEYVIPTAFANVIIEHFFKLSTSFTYSSSSSFSSSSELLQEDLDILQSRVNDILNKHTNNRAIHVHEAQLIQNIVQRMEITESANTQTTSLAENSVVGLCVNILTKHPMLRVIENNVQSNSNDESMILLYRDVLTLLANTLHYEGNDHTNEHGQNGNGNKQTDDSDEEKDIPLIFSTKSVKNGQNSTHKHMSETTTQDTRRDKLSLSFMQSLANVIRPVMLHALGTVGDDVAEFCVHTSGGFHFIFEPFLQELLHCTESNNKNIDVEKEEEEEEGEKQQHKKKQESTKQARKSKKSKSAIVKNVEYPSQVVSMQSLFILNELVNALAPSAGSKYVNNTPRSVFSEIKHDTASNFAKTYNVSTTQSSNGLVGSSATMPSK